MKYEVHVMDVRGFKAGMLSLPYATHTSPSKVKEITNVAGGEYSDYQNMGPGIVVIKVLDAADKGVVDHLSINSHIQNHQTGPEFCHSITQGDPLLC
jgi:hypothetical protein